MNLLESSSAQLLNLDILSGVFRYLPPESIVALARTSRQLHELIQASGCWKRFCTGYIDRHCRSQERGTRIRLEAFDASADASWWKLWNFLKRHEALMGFWALDAPKYGRLLVVRISPTTGKITCEALVQSLCSEASLDGYKRLRDTFDEFRAPFLLAINGSSQGEAVYLAPRHHGGVFACLHDPSISSALIFTIGMNDYQCHDNQFAVTYWRDRNRADRSQTLLKRTKPLQSFMTDLRPLPPSDSEEQLQIINLHKELPTSQASWHSMCPVNPSNPRSAERVIKDLDFGFQPPQPRLRQVDHLFPDMAWVTGREQYERGHYRPITVPRDANEAVEVFQGCSLAALAGLWIGYYVHHGPEVLYLRPVQPGGEAQGQIDGSPRVLLEAIKLIGDENVPCGEVSFQITPTPEEEAMAVNIPVESRPLNVPPWPLRSEGVPMGPVYSARGQVAATGFRSPGWTDCSVGIMSINQLAVHWVGMTAVTVFTRMTGM